MDPEEKFEERGPHWKPMVKGGEVDRHAYFERLRQKVRLRLLVAYITPFILLSIAFHYIYDATLREGINTHLKSIAENQRNTVDLFLQERVANLKSVFRVSLSPDPEKADMKSILEDLRHESPAFVDLGLFTSRGVLAAYAGPYPQLLGKDYKDEEWFRKLEGQPDDHYISDVYLGFRKRPHFIIAVRRPLGDETWILRASVDPEKFGEFVGSSQLIAEGDVYIVNSSGRRQTASAEPEGAQPALTPPSRANYTQIVHGAADGRDSLSAFAWLKENDWALVVTVPTDKAYAPIRRSKLVIVGGMLLTLALLVALVVGSTRRLIDRLEAADTDREELKRHLFNAAKLASVGEMAAGVAHEINNPLAIIYEEAGMMKDILDPAFGQKFDPEEFRERVGAIMEAAIRGRTITGNLLAFSRRHDTVVKPTDVNAILEKLVQVKEVEFKVSNIEVVKNLQADLPEILVNPNQMEQVLFNMLNNAKDAIADAGRITLRTRQEEESVVIEIEDTGCGMSEEQMEKIFFPFYTTKGVGKGTGLGLSISYGIVKSFGGGSRSTAGGAREPASPSSCP